FEFLQVGTRADHPMDEFWLPTKPQGRKHAFPGVLAGRSVGRQIIGAESFTSGPPEEKWNSHPFSLKALGDFIYCCGVNRFVIHVSAHQPLIGEHLRPGFTCGCNGIHFDRNNTWWQHGAKEWATYLARCQSLLQTGEHVADALYFQGNDSPDGIGPFDPALPDGCDFDACTAEVLNQLHVRDGQVMLPGGKSYWYLVLPRHGRVTLASLRKIAALAKDGAGLVGTLPKASPSLADADAREEYDRLIKDIKPASSFPTLMPDFAFDAASGLALHAIHRRSGEADLYFVASASPHAGQADCRFRVGGKIPELWRPDSGTMKACPAYERLGNVTRIPLRFEPAGSVFVVFRPGAAKVHAVGVERVGEVGAPPPVLTLRSAKYGPPNDAQRTRDLTRQVAARIENGKLKLRNFEHLAGDSAPGVVKQMQIEYELNGKPGTASAKDGEELLLPPPDNKLPSLELRDSGGQLELCTGENGNYRITFSDGHTQLLTIASVPAPQNISGPWSLEFPAGWGAPGKISLPKLISWTEHSDPGVKYFSGTATYRTAFQSATRNPKSQIMLDLGRVEVIAEVWLNGKSLGTLWKPPFRCDVTAALQAGENELEIRVTNLWPNRLIGDEQFPDDGALNSAWPSGGIRAWPDWVVKNQPRPEPRRQTFFTWKHWAKDDALLSAGLLGPVILQAQESAVVK
ncbi:MAG: glycosyl hydrolase, partial [Kiritimatiellaeota bacterium]|nr:glycosyl hydrolase [Kiritimatiellota bacterium]